MIAARRVEAFAARPRAATVSACDRSAAAVAAGTAVLVEVHIGRYASATMMALDTECHGLLLPLAPVLSLAGIAVDATHGLVRAHLASGTRLEVDLRRSLVRRGRARRTVEPGELVAGTEGILASLAAIGYVLGLDVTYDEASATIDVRGADALPVALEAVRVARRIARDSTRWRATEYGIERASTTLDTPTRTGVAVDYDLTAVRQSVPAP